MEYKSQKSLPTGIHTRINDTVRISSGWRNYSNEHFSSNAWETFLWDGEKIIGDYDTLKNADDVIDLHQEILKTYKKEESL